MRDFTACDRDAAEDGADRGGADRDLRALTQPLPMEVRLRELLADTYGADMVDVLIYAGDRTQTYYGSGGTETITGVLITIKKEAVTGTTIADITLAVCALFDLPAHKVAVLVKN